MSYASWFDKHAQKHKKIVDKLLRNNLSEAEIIKYFEFENMVKNENDFCPLYAEGKKCHDMKELNCYLCACPYFRFDDEGVEEVEGKIKYSYCHIDAKDGKAGIYGDKIHHDCSNCIVPHTKKFISKKFSYEWKNIMKDCNLKGIIKTKK